MLKEQDTRHSAKLETLHAAAALGLADLDAGRYETIEAEDAEAFLAALREPPGSP